MTTEWIVAGVFVFAGVVGAVGLFWGLQDPITRHYKPGVGGFFRIGRTLPRPEFDRTRDKGKKDVDDRGPGRK